MPSTGVNAMAAVGTQPSASTMRLWLLVCPRHPDFRHTRAKYACRPIWILLHPSLPDSQLRVEVRAFHDLASDTSENERISFQIQNLCKEELLDKALGALQCLDQQGIVPSVHLYKILLQLCMKKKALAEAKLIYSHFAKHGRYSTSFLNDLAVTTLVKCGGLAEGLQLFRSLARRTVYSWTAIISGYMNAGFCREAVLCYDQMLQEGVNPDEYTFVSLLQACSRLEDIQQGKRIHADAVRYGYDSDVFVGSTLVTMYSSCGSMVDAEEVFENLSQQDVVSWTTMIAAYAQHGQGQKALQTYWRMQDEGVRPNAWTCVTGLQACGVLAGEEQSAVVDGQSVKLGFLQNVKRIHAEAAGRGCVSDVYVGSTLVRMYAKCGGIMDAEYVFHQLSKRDVVLWTVMLAAYAQQGQGAKALQIFRQMQDEGVMPDAQTLGSILQACAVIAEQEESAYVDGAYVKTKSLQIGKEVHAEAASMNLDSYAFVGRTLVNMYIKCGSIRDAQQVFDKLSQRDVVSSTAMIAAYAQHDQGRKALQIYHRMQADGVRPDTWTFVSALQACGILAEKDGHAIVDGRHVHVECLQKGKSIHAETVRRGLESDPFVGNTLVSIYAKCGSMKDVEHVFLELSHRDRVSWNAMLAAYTLQDQGEECLQTYGDMQAEGVRPDARTFVSVLQAYGILSEKEEATMLDGQSVRVGMLQKGKILHAEAASRGFGSDMFIATSLVNLYGKCGSIKSAEQVFDGLTERNVVSWTAMLTAYAHQDKGEEGLQIFEQMREARVRPDAHTFVAALLACGSVAERESSVLVDGQNIKVESLLRGKGIHAGATSIGFESDVFVGSSLVSMYAKCGSIKDAEQVFDRLPQRNVVSWTAIIAACAQQGQGERALQLYAQMPTEGIEPNEATFLAVLEACGTTGALNICRQTHHIILERGLKHSPFVGNSLVHAFSKCGSMLEAQEVFDSLSNPDVVSWNGLIGGYARNGGVEHSLRSYEDMQLAAVKPDRYTFIALLSACSHAGMVDKGLEYFEIMNRDHGIPAEVEHYVCIMDLVARAGLFRKAEDLLLEMPMEPDLRVWLSLLGACQKHGNVVLGRRAFDGAVGADPEHAAAYVLMSNIYAHAGMFHLAKEVDEMRHKAAAWKEPGESWIEHRQEVHTFLVGDKRHQQFALVDGLLKELSARLKVPGSFKQLCLV